MTQILEYLGMHWPVLLGGSVLGFVIGVLTGLFGAGGGFIIVPALNIFLGLPMPLAIGTSACQVLGASGFSLYHHLDRRFLGIRVALFMGLGIPLGAYLGATLVERFKQLPPWFINGREIVAVDIILLLVFAVFLSLIAGWLFFDNFYLRRHRSEDESQHRGYLSGLAIPPCCEFRTIPAGSFSIPVLFCLGLGMGFLSGLLGIGGGVIMLPMLFYLVGQKTKFATRTDMMLVFTSGFFAAVVHGFRDNIHYILVLFLIAGAFFGTRAGARIQQRITGRSIRRYFAFVVLAAVFLVIYKIIMLLQFGSQLD